MEEKIKFGGITVLPLYTEREVNFTVLREQEYLFRLVPVLSGFAVSPLDRSLGRNVDLKFVTDISSKIEDYYM